jgi:hypothetical protein
MNRKLLALAIVLLFAGLAPASAIIGFCKRMPCCNHADAAPAALSTQANGCCTTVACYESPSAKLTGGASATDAVFAMPAVTPIAAAAPQPSLARECVDASPPASARQRLAARSVLLI